MGGSDANSFLERKPERRDKGDNRENYEDLALSLLFYSSQE
jgi:hypothetical protein